MNVSCSSDLVATLIKISNSSLFPVNRFFKPFCEVKTQGFIVQERTPNLEVRNPMLNYGN